MSKKKNTLNDLQEFLKLQASTLVQPQGLEVKEAEKNQTVLEEEKDHKKISKQETYQPFNIVSELKKMAHNDKQEFYSAIAKSVENLPNGSKDILLINTALYLKHGDNWKAALEAYWSNRK